MHALWEDAVREVGHQHIHHFHGILRKVNPMGDEEQRWHAWLQVFELSIRHENRVKLCDELVLLEHYLHELGIEFSCHYDIFIYKNQMVI